MSLSSDGESRIVRIPSDGESRIVRISSDGESRIVRIPSDGESRIVRISSDGESRIVTISSDGERWCEELHTVSGASRGAGDISDITVSAGERVLSSWMCVSLSDL